MPPTGPTTRSHSIEDEGTPLGAKPKLNFVGAGVDVANVGNKTVVTIPGSADANIDAHLDDATAAHAASAISFTPDGSIAATTVQDAIVEVRNEAGVGGGSVNDQTIVLTDNTVNNVTTSKHGWTPKLTNNISHYLSGKGSWVGLYPATTHAWYVDTAAAAGGDGLTPRGAFTSFNTAVAAAQPRDTIYLISDIQENGILNKANVRVQGLGQRVWYAQPGSSINNTSLDVRALNCQIDNIWFAGHSTFKGVHLLLNNYSNYYNVSNIYISGTGGVEPTFYPTSPSAGTGLGGIGILCHHAEVGTMENLFMIYCSIAVGLGTWSSRATISKVQTASNCQDLVMGLYTGSSGAVANMAATFGYGLVGHGANDQTGMGVFRDWSCVNALNATLTSSPTIDLIGDGTSNYGGFSGWSNVLENMNCTESGGTPRVRIGTVGNTIIKPINAAPTTWLIEGRNNTILSPGIGNDFKINSDFNTVDGSYPYNGDAGGTLRGAGSFNVFRNCDLRNFASSTFSLTGSDNTFEKCWWRAGPGAAAITRASLGGSPTIKFSEGPFNLTYGTTVTTYAHGGTQFYLNVTNGTAFTMSNPVDNTNGGDTSKIMVTTPITYDILNSSGGSMGAITWGPKFALAGAFTNPANGKRRTITFYYNFTSDKWVETARSGADI